MYIKTEKYNKKNELKQSRILEFASNFLIQRANIREKINFIQSTDKLVKPMSIIHTPYRVVSVRVRSHVCFKSDCEDEFLSSAAVQRIFCTVR
jgi:hypothetical protein